MAERTPDSEPAGAPGPETPPPAPERVTESAAAPGGIVAAAAAPAPGDESLWRDRRTGNRTVRLLVLGGVVLLLLWLARGVIAPFVIAAIIAYAFDPLVSGVRERTRLPRAAIIAIGYAVTLAVLGVVLFLVSGRVATEIRELSSSGQDVIAAGLQRVFGDRISIAGEQLATKDVAASIRTVLVDTFSRPTDSLRIVAHAVDIGLQAILTLILAFYLLLDGDRFARFSLRFLDRRKQARTVQIARRIHVVLGRWLRGQLFLIGLVAFVLYLLLGPVLGVPFSLTIAIMSGVLEIIPLVGPIVAAAIAIAVAFGESGPNTAFAVLVIYVIVRQVEDQVIMPIVIGRAVHLHPVVTIFAVLVGLSTFGVLGGLLGVPVAAALNVTLHELYPEASDDSAAPVEPRER